MNNTLRVSKYIFQDFKKALIIYYGIILGIFLLMNITYLRISAQPGSLSISAQPNSDISFGGFGFSAVMFMFVSGLNCFKANFKFMQANNVSRKRFYMGTMITLIFVSALMAFVDASFNKIFNLVLPYEGMFAQLYKNGGFFPDFAWSFALMVFSVSSGWFITMLYYRCNKLMKLVVSFIPIFAGILIVLLDRLTMGALIHSIIQFLTISLGFVNYNPYIAVLSFFIASIAVLGLSYILIRRTPIRD